MNKSRPKKKLPRDVNQLAKAIVDIASSDVQPEPEESPRAAAGRKGGTARKETLTPSERSEIAKKAAAARWDNR